MNLRSMFAVGSMLTAVLAMPGTASAAPPTWAPAASATIHPGVDTTSLRLGVSALDPKTGTVDSVTADGRGYSVHFRSGPAISGDSGSGVMNAQGQAMADLQFLIINGASTNLAGDLGLELSYLAAHAPIPGLQLADATEPFNPTAATVLPA